jgi:uncharacterized protein YkwD
MNAFMRVFRDHFIPHKGNGHHPKLLRHTHLFGMGALLVVLKSAAITVPILLPGALTHATEITPSAIVELTNQTRATERLTPLIENDALDRAAQKKAADMASKQYFSHEMPDGRTAMDLVLAEGYRAKLAAENLAVRYDTAEDVQQGWLLSPTHRENIINPVYRNIGVGVAHGPYRGKDSVYVVQLFGQPADASAVAVGAVTPAPTTPAEQTWQDAITGSLRSASEAADAIIVILLISLLLLTLSVKFHEKHLATITEAFALIGMAIVLRLF